MHFEFLVEDQSGKKALELLADAIYSGGHESLLKKGWREVGKEKSEWAANIHEFDSGIPPVGMSVFRARDCSGNPFFVERSDTNKDWSGKPGPAPQGVGCAHRTHVNISPQMMVENNLSPSFNVFRSNLTDLQK
jgi:hypothetical protein